MLTTTHAQTVNTCANTYILNILGYTTNHSIDVMSTLNIGVRFNNSVHSKTHLKTGSTSIITKL